MGWQAPSSSWGDAHGFDELLPLAGVAQAGEGNVAQKGASFRLEAELSRGLLDALLKLGEWRRRRSNGNQDAWRPLTRQKAEAFQANLKGLLEPFDFFERGGHLG
ncbi:MAG: hypothetical protein R2748_04075 [Bryobacterales bacterium]